VSVTRSTERTKSLSARQVEVANGMLVSRPIGQCLGAIGSQGNENALASAVVSTQRCSVIRGEHGQRASGATLNVNAARRVRAGWAFSLALPRAAALRLDTGVMK